MRQCVLTRANLPKYFLQDFEAVLHPETNVPNFLPRSLAVSNKAQKFGEKKLKGAYEDNIKEVELEENRGKAKDFEDGTTTVDRRQQADKAIDEGQSHASRVEGKGDKEAPKTPTISPSSRLIPPAKYPSIPSHTPSRGQRTHILLRHSLVEAITRKPTKNQRNRFVYAYTRFAIRAPMSQHQWRPDMAEWVLELRRRRIVEMLEYLILQNHGYIIPCGNEERSVWDDAKTKKQIGALLWVGKLTASPSKPSTPVPNPEPVSVDSEIEDPALIDSVKLEGGAPPPEFAILEIGRPLQKKTKIPVHSLTTLLGPSKLSHLYRQHPKIFSSSVIAIKHRHRTLSLQMQLWALQGYMARHGHENEDLDQNLDGDDAPSTPLEEVACPICQNLGHMAHNCPTNPCSICGETGHGARKCPEARCKFCNEKGHKADKCPNPVKN